MVGSDFERSDPGYLAGPFFIGGITDDKKRTLEKKQAGFYYGNR